METAFARWLQRRGLPPYRFADLHGLQRPTVYGLAGVGTKRVSRFFKPHTLAAVSEITGISPRRLMEEAMLAMEDPRPPRRYVRKNGGGDAAAAE